MSLRNLEIVGYIDIFIFDDYLIRIDAPDVRCKYYHHFT